MNRDDFLARLYANYATALGIIEKKNHDYAGEEDPFKNFRLSKFVLGIPVPDAIMVRMLDKVQRIGQLLHMEASVKDESIQDTLLDLMNYANIMLVYLQKGGKDE